MKRNVFVFILLLITVSVFSRGMSQIELVNEREILLGQIDVIQIRYNSENIVFSNHNSNTIIIKEYMSDNNKNYYAKIINSGTALTVEAGERPLTLSGGALRVKVEVFIPASKINLAIKTSSGSIEGYGEIAASSVILECSSGSINVNSIAADTVKIKTSSGSIRCNSINGNAEIDSNSGSIAVSVINGDVSAESSSGRIELNKVSGQINAKASSGSIRCAVAQNNKDVSIATSSGSVTLAVPENAAYNVYLNWNN